MLAPGRAPYRLRRSGLPAPAHLSNALLRYPHLSLSERLGAARAALALGRLDPSDAALDGQTFGEWLARRGQGPRAVAALWDLIALPTLNLPAAEASLGLAAFVFQEGLLSSAGAGDIGFHVGTLQQIIGDPALRALREAGVDVRLGWRAERLERGEDGYRLEGRDGSGEDRIEAEAAVVALPHDRAGGLLAPLLGHLGELDSSPIINIHILYDRRVLDEPFAAGVGTPVQYLFDRSAAGGAPAGTQYLAISLSGAAGEMEESVPALRERYLAAMDELLPRARTARVELFLVTREHAATFRAAPGTAALRPRVPDPPARPRPRRHLDRHGLAGDARERRAERRARRPGRPRRAGRSGGAAGGGGAMTEVLVAAPMRIEAALISSAARSALVHKTGMGPHRSRAAAGALDGRAARALIVVGLLRWPRRDLRAGGSDRRRAGLRGSGREPSGAAGPLRAGGRPWWTG